MSVLPAVTLVLFVFAAVGAEEQAKQSFPTKPFTHLLTFKNDDYMEAFKSLDVNNDDEITIDELKSFYYHADSEFAVQKFMDLVDTSKSPGVIHLEEFTNFMNKDKVKRQVHYITLATTKEGRLKYFADEILTYVYLVMDENSIDNLFDVIDTSSNAKDGKLDFDEIKDIQVKSTKGNPSSLKLTDLEAKLFLMEIGGGSDTISKEDFKEYLLDGNLSFLFRECRDTLTSKGAEYDNGCLVRKLVRFTTKHLTEYMMTLIFDVLDAQDKNQIISVEDLQKAFGCNEWRAKYFIMYVGGKNEELSYGDLRPSIDEYPVKTYLEKECSKEDINRRISCFQWSFYNLISTYFSAKNMGVPDLDVIFLFEDLDTTNDGKIEPKADLQDGKHWNRNLAQKFMVEVAPPERKTSVNLDDFFHYMSQPYMMCSVSVCQVVEDNQEKLACYNREMKDMITHVLTNNEVNLFFKFYHQDVIYYPTLKRLEMAGPEIGNYLNELGHGDLYVTPVEFRYFVKQQEPSHLFVTDTKAAPRKHLTPEMLHNKLLHYLENYMTEYDTIVLFLRLDVTQDHVIDNADIEKLPDIGPDLLEKMAVYGNKEHVSFSEFWIFLNTKLPDSEKRRKSLLEDGCANMGQEPQIDCFVSKLKELK